MHNSCLCPVLRLEPPSFMLECRPSCTGSSEIQTRYGAKLKDSVLHDLKLMTYLRNHSYGNLQVAQLECFLQDTSR